MQRKMDCKRKERWTREWIFFLSSLDLLAFHSFPLHLQASHGKDAWQTRNSFIISFYTAFFSSFFLPHLDCLSFHSCRLRSHHPFHFSAISFLFLFNSVCLVITLMFLHQILIFLLPPSASFTPLLAILSTLVSLWFTSRFLSRRMIPSHLPCHDHEK